MPMGLYIGSTSLRSFALLGQLALLALNQLAVLLPETFELCHVLGHRRLLTLAAQFAPREEFDSPRPIVRWPSIDLLKKTAMTNDNDWDVSERWHWKGLLRYHC